MIVKRFLALVLILILLFGIIPTDAQASKPTVFTLASLGYDSDLVLQGAQASRAVWVPLLSNWLVTQDVKATVSYTASPVLNEPRSTLSVLVNGNTVYSWHPVGDGVPHTISFTIPRTAITGAFAFGFRSFLHITDAICEEANNPGQWVRIGSQTELDFTTNETTIAPKLSGLSRAIVVQSDQFAPPPIVFVLPDQWNATDLSTATRVAARLGKAINGQRPSITVVRTSELTPRLKQDANLVMIGKTGELPTIPAATVPVATASLVKGTAPTAIPTVLPPTLAANAGYIKIFNSPWNPARDILLISGATDADIADAGSIFASNALFALLRGGDTASVAAIVRTPVINSSSDIWGSDKTTFAQLGQSDLSVTGVGTNDQFVDVNLPSGWILQPGAQLVLNVANSPALSTEISHVAVYANDVYMGAISATKDGNERQYTLNVPSAVIQGSNGNAPTHFIEFRFSVANDLILSQCQEPTNTDVAWTRIIATSYLSTPHKFLAWPDLYILPYPFVYDKIPAPLLIVIPKDPSDALLSDAISLAAKLGGLPAPQLDLHIMTADQVTREKYADANLILLGKKGDQPLLDTFGKAITPIADPGVVSALANPDFGVLQEAVSPWNSGRAVLMIYSVSDASYRNALNSLISGIPPVDESGQVAVVQAGQAPRVVYRAATPAATAAATTPETGPATAAAVATTAPTMMATISATAAATANP